MVLDLISGLWRIRRSLSFFCLAALSAAAVESCNIYGPKASINLHNDSDFAISQVLAADSGTAVWGDNLLGSPVQPDETRIIEGIDRKLLDIKIVFDTAGQISVVKTYDFTFTTRLNMEVRIPQDS